MSGLFWSGSQIEMKIKLKNCQIGTILEGKMKMLIT